MRTEQDLLKIAQNFLQQHQDEHLSHDQHRLFNRCIAHLLAVEEITVDTAQDIVLQAIGNREARHQYNVHPESLAG